MCSVDTYIYTFCTIFKCQYSMVHKETLAAIDVRQQHTEREENTTNKQTSKQITATTSYQANKWQNTSMKPHLLFLISNQRKINGVCVCVPECTYATWIFSLFTSYYNIQCLLFQRQNNKRAESQNWRLYIA